MPVPERSIIHYLNWENVRSKYKRIQEILTESYTKNSEESKEFPVLDNPEVISKD